MLLLKCCWTELQFSALYSCILSLHKNIRLPCFLLVLVLTEGMEINSSLPPRQAVVVLACQSNWRGCPESRGNSLQFGHLCSVKWSQFLRLEMMWGVISTALVQDTARVMAALMVSNCTNMKWAEFVEAGFHKLFEVWGCLLSLFIIPVLGLALKKHSVYFKLFPLSGHFPPLLLPQWSTGKRDIMTTVFKNIQLKMRSCICSVNVLVFRKTNLHVCRLLGLNTPAIGSKANKYLSILCQGLGKAGSREEQWRIWLMPLAHHGLSWCVRVIQESSSAEPQIRAPAWDTLWQRSWADLVRSGPCFHFE